ncbi:hypothetical protein J6590_044235 [Homalodisca vitripennis]|nr:hypothetical protein J6590_044235 [Homalodisca vitripennis]
MAAIVPPLAANMLEVINICEGHLSLFDRPCVWLEICKANTTLGNERKRGSLDRSIGTGHERANVCY